MGHAKRTVLVHARKSGGDIKWGMSGYGVTSDRIKCKKDGMKKGDKNVVVFEIVSHPPLNLRFPSDPARAMWVSDDAMTCPGSQPRAQHPVIKAKSVSPDGEQLTVENKNTGKEQYKFALNFVDAGDEKQTTLYQYDPIWENQNGGHS